MKLAEVEHFSMLMVAATVLGRLLRGQSKFYETIAPVRYRAFCYKATAAAAAVRNLHTN